VSDIPAPSTSTAPVVLVHGWGGSFTSTWERSGFTTLLAEGGREVIGVDLLGHGSAPKPHSPEDYSDLGGRVLDAIDGRGPVDAVGFSLGALTLLRIAVERPGTFGRLVLAGIGRNVFEHDPEQTARIVAAIESGGDTDDNRARLFAQYAAQDGNDPVALAAVLRSDRGGRLTEADLASVTCPTLVAVGDQDFVLPTDRLVAALGDARFVSLRRTDHFATPESFDFIDATLEFLDALPV
jgi:pimeloyl-ACP methyl ester carboxylesterase